MSDTPRIYLALRPEDAEVFFTPRARARLAALGSVEAAPAGPGRVACPPGLADAYDVVITGWGTDSAGGQGFLGSRLGLVAHTAGSVRAVAPAQVLARDVRVTQAGVDPMAEAVAEFALTLTLSLLRHLHTYDRALQSGAPWAEARQPAHGDALAAQRIGLVGLGRVARHYLTMITALGATDVAAYDPYCPPQEAERLGCRLTSLDDIFTGCDVVAVHAPVTDETRGMIGAHHLGLLRDGACLINTARSAVIDTAALTDVLRRGRIRAALDVFDDEPLPADSPLLGLPNVICTPHVAGATTQARFAMGDEVVAEIRRYLAGEPLHYEVTAASYERLA